MKYMDIKPPAKKTIPVRVDEIEVEAWMNPDQVYEVIYSKLSNKWEILPF